MESVRNEICQAERSRVRQALIMKTDISQSTVRPTAWDIPAIPAHIMSISQPSIDQFHIRYRTRCYPRWNRLYFSTRQYTEILSCGRGQYRPVLCIIISWLGHFFSSSPRHSERDDTEGYQTGACRFASEWVSHYQRMRWGRL